MSFTNYHVEADYVPRRGDIVGPGAICQTREQAEALARQWRENWRSSCYDHGQALCVENVRIIEKRYD